MNGKSLPQILIFSAFFVIISCSPKVRTSLTETTFSAIPDGFKIFLLEENEEVPEGSEYLGEIKIGDSGFSTMCDYDISRQSAKDEARAKGANLVKITRIREPNMVSSCYRIDGKLYRNLDSSDISKLIDSRKVANRSTLPQDADYAVIHFYRPYSYVGSAIGYKIWLRNEKLFKIQNGDYHKYTTDEEGWITFWASTEAKSEVILFVENGMEYFVKCDILMGAMVGQPKLTLMEPRIGRLHCDRLAD